MSRAESIREYLRNIGAVSPETAVPRPQIREATGMATDILGELKKAGFIASLGPVRGLRFYLTGKEPTVYLSREEARQRSVQQKRERRRAAGMLSRAEWVARSAAKRAATKESRKAESEKRKAERRAAVSAVLAVKRAKKQAAKRVAKARAVVEPGTRFTSIAAPKAVEVLPSVDAWLAQGGKVERLDVGAVSKPFRAIGLNNRRAAA